MLIKLIVPSSSSSFVFTNSNYYYDYTNTNTSAHLCDNNNVDPANTAKNQVIEKSVGNNFVKTIFC